MRAFDWEEAKKRNNEGVFNFYKEYHDIALTEDKFIELWGGLRKFARTKQPAKRYSPSRAKMNYKYLKREFGFFT